MKLLSLLCLTSIFLLTSCSDDRQVVSETLETQNLSDIWLKAPANASYERYFSLIASAPNADDTLVLCEADHPLNCDASRASYQQISKLQTTRNTTRSFFRIQNINFRQGQLIAIRTFPSSNPSAFRVRIVRIGDSAGSIGTSPGGVGRQSGGTGGEKNRLQSPLPTFASGNLSSVYRVWAPQDNGAGRAHPLVVYMHGDTGSNFGDPRLDPRGRVQGTYAALGQQYPTIDQARFEAQSNPNSLWKQAVFVSILSPVHNGQFLTWNTSISATQKVALADYVDNLVQQQILAKYNIDLDRTYFVGQSSGANFVSTAFVPRHGSKYRGGAIMLCAGEAPLTELQFRPTQAFLSTFKLHYETTGGELAQLKISIPQSLAAYRQLYGSLATSHITSRNAGTGDHCIFRQDDDRTPISQPTLIESVIRRMQQ